MSSLHESTREITTRSGNLHSNLIARPGQQMRRLGLVGCIYYVIVLWFPEDMQLLSLKSRILLLLIVVKNPKWTNAVGIIYGTFCIIGILATLASAVTVIWFRDDIVIKACRYQRWT